MGTVVVTGGAGALGGALVRALHANGDRVAALDAPRADAALRALATELGGDRVVARVADVASPDAWKDALAEIEAKLGPVDGAALIAGGWAGGAKIHEAKDDAAWTQMVHANLDTTYASVRALVPGMVARRRGSVVVVGSRAVERPWTSAGAAAYAATKSGVVALAEAVAEEVREHGVRVNAVLPSTIDTRANRAAMPDADASKWVSTASLAGVIAFLLSDAARDVSGAAIPVYGRA